MFISNISDDNNDQLFENPIKQFSATVLGDHMLLGFYDAPSFETPRLNNHSVTEPSARGFLNDDSAKSF